MNPSSLRGRRPTSTLCAESGPEDGVDPRVLARARQTAKPRQRQDRQLGKEAFRELSLILAGETADPLLRGLGVVAVEVEDAGRQLCVTLGHTQPVIATEADILAALERARGHWRTLLAHSLGRKRVPTLRYRYIGLLGEV
ncbi:Ribosome-binding factor A [Methylomagnum ishizawai]|uniref:Ribosome-binding factor A n=1 Tax=Methylomagnum ishizawai TaxID=1760988 RepID=A0A1Y6D2V6_9GAMM|nr:ribosome-binding factor A [Methylomagnum ishizawai]SMF96720.1 Ribosome-binding factor A [Methylomagnum ishizawai]